MDSSQTRKLLVIITTVFKTTQIPRTLHSDNFSVFTCYPAAEAYVIKAERADYIPPTLSYTRIIINFPSHMCG